MVFVNGVKKDHFYPREKINNGKVNIVTHHWSSNELKGFDIYNLLEKVIEEDKDVDEALEELSSMAGGSVEGYAVSQNKKKKKKPTIFREEDEIDEDRAAVQPGGTYPSARDADDDTNEYPAEPKYKIAKEQSEVEEIANYLLEAGVFIG